MRVDSSALDVAKRQGCLMLAPHVSSRAVPHLCACSWSIKCHDKEEIK